jgi:hypothetical protein
MKRLGLGSVIAGLLVLAGAREAAAIGNLVNHGGPTMQSARVHFIFWLPPGTSFDPTVMGGVGNFESLPARFVNDLSGTAYFNTNTEYPGQCGASQCVVTNGPGVVSLGGSFVETRAYPHAGTRADPLQDSDIQNEITRAIAANGWTAGMDAEFFVLTAAGIEECSGGPCTFDTYCAYHASFDSGGRKVIYGYLSDASFNVGGCSEGLATGTNGQLSSDREVALLTHEFFESITDPISGSSAWWNPSDGNEGGDNCNQIPSTVPLLNGNSYDVQRQWSNDTSSCIASFGPTVQLNIATGGDDLRGSSTATASLERTDLTSIRSVTLKGTRDPGFGGGSTHIVVAGYGGGATELANLGVTLTSHNGFIETDDNWNIDRLSLRLLAPSGALICQQDLAGDPLARLTGSVPTATFGTPSCSPPPPMATFDHMTFNIATGGDDLRGDSDVTARIAISGQPPQTVAIKAQSDPGFAGGSTKLLTFALASAQPLSAFGNVTLTLTSHNGFIETDDNWNIQTINVTLSGSSGSACLFSGVGNPFSRLTGSGPSVTLTAGSGC